MVPLADPTSAVAFVASAVQNVTVLDHEMGTTDANGANGCTASSCLHTQSAYAYRLCSVVTSGTKASAAMM